MMDKIGESGAKSKNIQKNNFLCRQIQKNIV